VLRSNSGLSVYKCFQIKAFRSVTKTTNNRESSDGAASGYAMMNRWFGSRTLRATGRPVTDHNVNYFYCLVGEYALKDFLSR
jgi:hypothetical protein